MNTTQGMRRFSGFRNTKELAQACKKRGWKLNTKRFDEGSDYVSFQFKVGRTQGNCLVSTVNGRFFGTFGAKQEQFSSDNTNHESYKWFQELLETIYV